jgi:hypothetical protein
VGGQILASLGHDRDDFRVHARRRSKAGAIHAHTITRPLARKNSGHRAEYGIIAAPE